MRIDELRDRIDEACDLVPPEYSVSVILGRNNYGIERVDVDADGRLTIHLEE